MQRLVQALVCAMLLMTLVSCGAPGVPVPPSLELPEPARDLHAIRKGDTVTLTWTVPNYTTYHKTIRNLGDTLICRSPVAAMSECGAPVGRTPPPPEYAPAAKRGRGHAQQVKLRASYSDHIPASLTTQAPAAEISYAVAVLNTSGKSAGLSNVAQVPSAPAVAPPADLKAQVTAEGVLLTWSPVIPPNVPSLRFVYRVYRKLPGGKEVLAGEIPVGAETTFVDRDFEWDKTYEYHVDVTTLAEAHGEKLEVEGDNSTAITVAARDVFPPAVPTGLQAVASTVGTSTFIDLVWAPDTDRDLAGYNVYRREGQGDPVRITSALAQTPAFRDTTVRSGHTYAYSVSAMDLRGNESARSEPATEKVP
jgi:hypothetical protein